MVVVAVGGSPGQVAGDEGVEELVDVGGAVLAVGAGAVEEVAVDDDKVRRLSVQDGFHHLEGVGILDVACIRSLAGKLGGLGFVSGPTYCHRSEDLPKRSSERCRSLRI